MVTGRSVARVSGDSPRRTKRPLGNRHQNASRSIPSCCYAPWNSGLAARRAPHRFDRPHARCRKPFSSTRILCALGAQTLGARHQCEGPIVRTLQRQIRKPLVRTASRRLRSRGDLEQAKKPVLPLRPACSSRTGRSRRPACVQFSPRSRNPCTTSWVPTRRSNAARSLAGRRPLALWTFLRAD